MPRKSEFKHIFKAAFPNCFVEDDDPEIPSPTYAIEDAMIQLSKVSGWGDKVDGSKVVNFMLKNAMASLNSLNCKEYALTFDKPDFVPRAKGIEQKNRSKKRKIAPCPNPEPGETILTLNGTLPYGWESIMANRKARRVLIAQIVKASIENFYPPAGKALIIDGGLGENDGKPVLIQSIIPDDDKKIDNDFRSVVMLNYSDSKRNSLTSREITEPEDLQNKAGEGDVCYLFHLENFVNKRRAYREENGIPAEKDPIVIEIRSRDTDFIPISLSFFRKIENDNITLKLVLGAKSAFKKKKKVPIQENNENNQDSKKKKPKKNKPVDDDKHVLIVNRLYDEIKKGPGKHQNWPELTLVAAMMSTGNDYVDGYGDLTPERVFDVWFKHGAYIGDIVTLEGDGKWTLNYDNYLRFLKCLYVERHRKSLMKELKYEGKKTDEEEEKFEHYWRYQMKWKELRGVVTKHNEKRESARIPASKIIWLKFQRLQFNLELIRNGYKLSLEEIDEMCLNYGFSLVDPKEPISSGNIRYTDLENDQVEPPRKFMKALEEVNSSSESE